MRVPASALLVLLALAGGARAEDPAKPEADVCASLDWPLTREQTWFVAPDLPTLASGSQLPSDRPAALLTLKPTCPSSDDLRRIEALRNGGSGPSG